MGLTLIIVGVVIYLLIPKPKQRIIVRVCPRPKESKMSNQESITIKDESKGRLKKFTLYVDGMPRGGVESNQQGYVNMRFYPCGPCQLRESQNWLQGMLELSVIADKLEQDLEPKRGKKK